MNRVLVRILLLLVVLAGMYFGITFLTREKPVAVVLAEVSHGRVEDTVANSRAGTVTACRRAKLAPLSSGRVVELRARKGDHVRAGDLLLRLWNDDIEADLRRAESAFATARARADEACRMAAWAESERVRLAELVKDGVTSQQRLDQAEAEHDARVSSCLAAKSGIIEAEKAAATVRAALQRMELYAPFDGVIAETTAEEGEIVTPSPPGIPTPPAFDLIESGCLYVEAPIDEVDAPRVKLGLPARVTLDAFPGRSFAGKVRRVASYVLDVERQSRTVEIEVALEDPSAISELAPGYSADVEVIIDTREGVARVPTEAVMEGGRVLVLDGPRLAERKIERGLANWQFTEIRSGVTVGEKVVTSLDRAGVTAGAKARAE